MRKEAKELIEALKPAFAKDPNIKHVYVFGSQAKGTAKINSDLDLAIVSENPSLVDRASLRCVVDDYDIECDFVYTMQDLIDNAVSELDINNSIKLEGAIVWTRWEVIAT